VSDVVSRLGVTLEALSQSISEVAPASARLHAEIPNPEQAAQPLSRSRI